MIKKVCSKCNEELDINNFYKDGQKKDGTIRYRGECKKCIKEKRKIYCENNKEKIKEKRKIYYESNKEIFLKKRKIYCENNKIKIKKSKKKYYENNKSKIREYREKYYEYNKEVIKEYNKEYYKNNKEKIKEYSKEYNKEHYENNKEKIKEYSKEYYKNNKEYYSSKRHERRLKTKENGGFYTKEQLEECLSFFDYKCAYSGEEILEDLSNVHREHIIPVSKGGNNYIWNIVTSVASVNLSKKDKDMEEWYREQPYFSEERLNKIYQWIEYSKNKYDRQIA